MGEQDRIDAAMRRLAPIIGQWRTSGWVLGTDGTRTDEIAGTDTYAWGPGERWIIHHIDVTMGERSGQGLELIGDPDPETTRYAMRAFDASGSFSEMALTVDDDGVWHFGTDGARATLRIAADGSGMSAGWERTDPSNADGWIPWMDVRFVPVR